jgi:peptidyl-tRNA hydrolase
MGNGKIAAQCAHATLRAFQSGRHKTEIDIEYAGTFIQWLETGKKMVYLKVED